MKRLNGVHLKHLKNTKDEKTVIFPLPKTVTISMAQNMGAPCNPLVQKGDYVFVGQKIGDTDAFMSVPVHSSVSGTVVEITDYLMTNGRNCNAIVIESDGKQQPLETLCPPDVSTKEAFVKAVRESGACGLGGAGFPTHIKLNFDPAKTPIDTLIINAAECEPYITSDYRELMENPNEILEGIRLVMSKLDIPYAKLCIESNKPDAIAALDKMAKMDENISVVKLPAKYPQGAEKVIIYSATGRIVEEGQLPSNQKVIVMNVSTIAFVNNYIKTGMPLISRRLTVDGNAVAHPCNLNVLIGTSVKDVLDYAEAKDYKKVLMGGPMMGTPLYDITSPIVKTNNALLALKNVKPAVTTNCIRCGACIKACPMDLMPTMLEKAYDHKDVDALKKFNVMLCMNCGCCSYVCPASRPLAEKNQLAKLLIPRK